MKKLIAGLILFTLPLFANASETVTLTSRSVPGGQYLDATYSFIYKNKGDVELTRNNWDILYEAVAGGEDYFNVETVVDDFSFIWDLGQRSCESIKSQSNYTKEEDPIGWLAYSEIDPSQMKEHKSQQSVKADHCYLIYDNDYDGRVIAMFRVLDHTPGKSVTIGEIFVFDRMVKFDRAKWLKEKREQEANANDDVQVQPISKTGLENATRLFGQRVDYSGLLKQSVPTKSPRKNKLN